MEKVICENHGKYYRGSRSEDCPHCNLEAANNKIRELEDSLTISEGMRHDYLDAHTNAIEVVKQIYAVAGEDPEISRLCNSVLKDGGLSSRP